MAITIFGVASAVPKLSDDTFSKKINNQPIVLLSLIQQQQHQMRVSIGNECLNTFLHHAKVLLRWKNENLSSGFMTKFSSVFGTTPSMCVVIWKRLLRSERLKCRTSPMHLLWTLLFLKTYGKESIMSTIVEADEKTVRKWVWHIAELIADMDNDVVSNCFG